MTSPYDPAARFMLRGAQADKLTPDEAARQKALARAYGVTPDIVSGDPDAFRDREQADALDKTLRDTPAVGTWASRSRHNAVMARDDHSAMADGSGLFLKRQPPKPVWQRLIEGGKETIDNFAEGFDAAVNTPVLPYVRAAAGDLTAGNLASAVGAGTVATTAGLLSSAARVSDLLAFRPAATGATAGVEPVARWLNSKADELRPEAKTTEGRAILAGVESLPASLGALAGGVALRSAGLASTLMGAASGGGAYLRGREEGLSVEAATLYGLVDGVIEAGTEQLPFSRLIGGLGAGDGFFKRLIKSGMAEVPGEQVATFAQDLNAWVAIEANKGKTFDEFLSERPGAAYETLIASLVTTGAVNVAAEGMVRAARRMGKTFEGVPQAEQDGRMLELLTEVAAQSKVAQRDPASFEEFIQEASDGSGAENVYVDAAQLVETFNQAGITPDEAARLTGSTADEIAMAAETGADLRIPVGVYTTQLAQSEVGPRLLDHLRIDPDAPSRAEAQAFLEAAGDELRDIAAAEAQSVMSENEQAQARDALRDGMHEQLNAVGRFGSSTNYAYATLHAHVLSNLAEREGLPVATVAERYGLQVQAAGVDAATFNQLDLPQPENPLINVGLSRKEVLGPDAPDLTPEEVRAAFEQIGVDLIADSVQQSASEPTFVGALSRPLTPAEGEALSGATSQEAVAQYAGPDSALFGPMAETWGPFDPDQFMLPSGRTLGDTISLSRPLEGAPANSPGPHLPAREAAEAYMEAAGLPYTPPLVYRKIRRERAERIAAAFEAMEHNPADPEVRAAYAALAQETMAQWEAVKATGLVVEFAPSEGDPYGSPWDAVHDVRDNNHMFVFNTEDGYGQAGITPQDEAENPMLAIVPGEEWSGRQVRVNDIFRAVHEYFGHAKDGVGFRAAGEENAWRSHAAMFSPQARRALTTETRGQNSWLNYGPHGEHNRTASTADTIFAEQKIGLLPDWVMEEGGFADDYKLPGDAPALATTTEEDLAALAQSLGLASEDRRTAVYREVLHRNMRANADGEILVLGKDNQIGDPGWQERLARHGARFVADDSAEWLGASPLYLTTLPVNADGTLTVQHFAPVPGVTETDPNRWGDSGDFLPASERSMIGSAPARTYFGIATGVPGGYINEFGSGYRPTEGGRFMYEARIPAEDIYDRDANPDKLEATSGTGYDWAIRDAGYKGFWVQDDQLGMVAVMFEPVPVQPVPLDREASDFQTEADRRNREVKDRRAHLTRRIDDIEYEIGSDLKKASRSPDFAVPFDEMKEWSAEFRRGHPLAEELASAKGELESLAGVFFQSDNPNLSADTQRWQARLTDLPADDLKLVQVGRVPAALRILGVDRAGGIKMLAGKIRKATDGHPEVPFEVWSRLPELIAYPAAVYTRPSGVVVVLSEPDSNGDPILVPIDRAVEGTGHVIQTVYSLQAAGGQTGMEIAQQRFDNAARRADVFVWEGDRTAQGRVGTADVSGEGQGRADEQRFSTRPVVQVRKPSGQRRRIFSENDLVNRFSENFYQETGTPRGQIAFPADLTASPSVITLLRGADLSTFLHEAGHFYWEVMTDLAARPEASAALQADVQTMLTHTGVKDLETWRGMSVDERREAHEKIARSFEAYLFEGNAPNPELDSLFARVSRWMRAVYRSLLDLDVQLSDEVRGVFDRLVASDAAITEAQVQRGLEPLFTQRPEGVPDGDWNNYQREHIEATEKAVGELSSRSIRDMQFAGRAAAREIKRLQRENAENRRAVRDEVAAELTADPLYRAIRYMRTGVADAGGEKASDGYKMLTSAVRSALGVKDGEALPPALNGMTSEANGVAPQQIAELFGFDSADHLLRDVLFAAPLQEAVEAETDQRMRERFGELTSPEQLQEAAAAAVHNVVRGRFVATELAMLQKAPGKRRALAASARKLARDTINAAKLRNIRPGQYEAGERRSGRLALQNTGDLAVAAQHKRNQLLQFHLAREAHAARDEAEKIRKYLRKFDTTATRSNIDRAFLDQIDTVLEAVQLRPISDIEAQRRKDTAAWIEEMRAEGFEPMLTEAYLAEINRRAFRDLTMDEIRTLNDTVRNIEWLGRRTKELLTAKDKAELAEAAAEVGETIRVNAFTEVELPVGSRTNRERLASWFREFGANLRKLGNLVYTFDGGKYGGPSWERLLRPLNEAADREAQMNKQAADKLQALFDTIKNEDLHTRQFVPEIGKSISLETRLMVALNMGNEANLQRLIDGDAWEPAQIDAIIQPLTAKHWDFVENVWRFVDSYWPQITAKNERVTGVPLEKVEAVPFQIEIDGETRLIRGGYFPIKYDPDRSQAAGEHNAAEVAKQMMLGAYTRSSTRRGHTKERVDTVRGRPMRKDFGVIFDHTATVVHDLTHHEALIDVNRMLKHPAVDGAIRDHYGPEMVTALKQALEDIAAGNLGMQDTMGRALSYLRAGTTISAMAWNFFDSIQNTTGMFQSFQRVGTGRVLSGLYQWLGNPARANDKLEWIREQSPFMERRLTTFQRELNELRNNVGQRGALRGLATRYIPGVNDRVADTLVDSFFYLSAKMQLVTDVPTWIGQYDASMSAGEPHERAVAIADQAVIDAQSSGMMKDLSGAQRNKLFQLFTSFYGFFSTTYNLNADRIASFRRDGVRTTPIFLADMALLNMWPAIASTLLFQLFRGGDDDDLGEELLTGQVTFLTAQVPVLREVVSAVTRPGYAGPPSVAWASEAGKLFTQASQGELDEPLLRAMNRVFGTLLHYPAGQVDKTFRGIKAIADGEAGPQAVIFGPPPKQ